MKYFEFNNHEYYTLIGAKDLEVAKQAYQLHICDLEEYDKDPEEISREQAKEKRDLVSHKYGIPSHFEENETVAIEANEPWLVLIDGSLL